MPPMENPDRRSIILHRLLVSLLAVALLSHVCVVPLAGHQHFQHTATAEIETQHHEHGADSLSACSPDAVPVVGSPDLAVVDTPVIFFAARPLIPAAPNHLSPPFPESPPLRFTGTISISSPSHGGRRYAQALARSPSARHRRYRIRVRAVRRGCPRVCATIRPSM